MKVVVGAEQGLGLRTLTGYPSPYPLEMFHVHSTFIRIGIIITQVMV